MVDGTKRPATEKSPPQARLTCGWCNRVVGLAPDGVPRHVTCNDCRTDVKPLVTPAA